MNVIFESMKEYKIIVNFKQKVPLKQVCQKPFGMGQSIHHHCKKKKTKK